MREPQPPLFQAIAWSTDVVYCQTLERAAAAGLHIITLRRWYDIDTSDDLSRLHADLREQFGSVHSATLAVLNRMAPLIL